jgi:hypothetical protein
VLTRRHAWFSGQLDLDPAKLVFIDETGASTNLTRKSGRCRRGKSEPRQGSRGSSRGLLE